MPHRVIDASRRFRPAAPVLVLTDLQQEHVVDGGRYSVANAREVLRACRALVGLARQVHVPIAYSRRLEEASFFNPEGVLTDWVEELRPRPGEMIFEHALPSCYSSEPFARFFGHVREPVLLLAGFGANYTGLATAIDAYSRGHGIFVVRDAVGSFGLDAALADEHVCALIGQFAEMVSMIEAMALFGEAGHLACRRRRAPA